MQIQSADNLEGVPARCLACGRVFRHPPDEDVCPHCSSPDVTPLIFLSTTTLLAVCLCVLAWDLEAFVAAVHFLAGKKVNQAGHVVLVATSVVLTLFAYSKGRRELDKFQAVGARAAITWPQALLVVLLILLSSALIVLFIVWQQG